MNTYKEDTKYFNALQSRKKTCKHCGHTQSMHHLLEKVICRWCHHYIFRSEIDEFKYNLRKTQIKERRQIYER